MCGRRDLALHPPALLLLPPSRSPRLYFASDLLRRSAQLPEMHVGAVTSLAVIELQRHTRCLHTLDDGISALDKPLLGGKIFVLDVPQMDFGSVPSIAAFEMHTFSRVQFAHNQALVRLSANGSHIGLRKSRWEGQGRLGQKLLVSI